MTCKDVYYEYSFNCLTANMRSGYTDLLLLVRILVKNNSQQYDCQRTDALLPKTLPVDHDGAMTAGCCRHLAGLVIERLYGVTPVWDQLLRK